MCTRGYIHIHWLYLPSFCPHFKQDQFKVSAKSKSLSGKCIEKWASKIIIITNLCNINISRYQVINVQSLKTCKVQNSIPSNKHVAPNKCGVKEIYSKK